VDALVLPADSEVLLGAIPMKDMDLVIEPKTQTIQIDEQFRQIETVARSVHRML
jgi:hypothetical protein